MFIQSGRDNVVDYAHALIHCVVENVIDNDTLTLLNERAKRDSALHALLNGAFAAFCATNNHTDFRETVAMLGELVRGGGGDEEGELDAPAHIDAKLLDDARRADAELTQAALTVFAQTNDTPDLIDTLVRICAVHDAPVVANRRRVLTDQAMLARGDLSFLVLSDTELEARMAAAAARRLEQRDSFRAWFAGAQVQCPFDIVGGVSSQNNGEPAHVHVNDIDDNADDTQADFRNLLALRGADKPAHAALLQDYEDERIKAQLQQLQFMHTPSLLSFEENRFLARP